AVQARSAASWSTDCYPRVQTCAFLSRGRRRRRSDVEHLIGDARSGDGLERAFGIDRMLAKSPVMALPARWRFQPVDVRDVAARLADLALGEPVGRAPDFGGPEVRTVKDLARSYLSMTGQR